MSKILSFAAGAVIAVVATLLIITAMASSASAGGGGWQSINGGSSLYNYPSVAFTCKGPNGIYISSFANVGASAGGDIFVVKDDPECK